MLLKIRRLSKKLLVKLINTEKQAGHWRKLFLKLLHLKCGTSNEEMKDGGWIFEDSNGKIGLDKLFVE